MIRVLTLLLAFVASPLAAAELRMAVTTSFHNSGLSDVLLPVIEAETGIEVRLIVVGTGQAIRLGEAGDVDAILVHARAAEDAFVAAGHGTHRREIMYNDFVVVGPVSDPAQIADANTAADALRAVAEAEATFVSRGDDSGTHARELALWAEAGVNPDAAGDWYRATGSGMGAALNIAAGMDGYILSDRASWLNFGNKDGLAILFEGDPALFNQYAFIAVDPERHPHVKNDLAQTLEVWLVSASAQEMIGAYTIDGAPLFVPNATSAPGGESDG